RLEELSCAVRLRDVGVAACRARLFFVAAKRVRRNDDNWYMTEICLCLDAPRRLVSVKNRQLYIHQDEVRSLSFRCYERLFAVLRLDHFVTYVCEQIAQNLPVILLILNHQYALAHVCIACCSSRAGTKNENVAPWPRRDSIQMRPPCISTMRFTKARPSLAPPFALVIELSTCWNSWKIFAWSASSMPGPVSRTENFKEFS